nr:MAG TPA: dissimilatory sulfite reductase D [Caudoviricetes sp.]
MSTQRMANLLRTLVEDGRVIKTTEKRRVYYTKA